MLNKIFPKLSEEQVKEIIAIALIEEKGIEYDSIRKIIPHEIPEEICEFLTRCEIQSKYELEELRKFQEEKAEKSAIRKAVRKTRQTFTRQLKGVISLEKIVDAIWEILKDGKEINGDTIRNYSNIQSQEICDFLEREFKLRNIKVEAEVNIAVKKRGLLNINKIHDELEIQKSFIIKGVETHNFFNLVLLINRIRKNLIFKNITSFLYSECLSILDLEKFKTQNIEQPRLANILPSYVKFLKESQYWHIIERDFDEKLFYQQLSDRWLKSLYPHIKRITGSRKEEKKKNKIAEIKYFLEQYNPKFYPSKMTTVYIEGKQKKIIRHIIVKLNSDNVTVVPVGYEDLIKVKKGKKFFTMEYFPEEKKYEISYEELDVTKLDLILSRLKELNKEVDEEAKAFDKYSEEWKDLLRTNKELCEFCERQDILTSENSHALCEVMTGGNLSNIGSINVLNVLYFLFEGEVAQDFFNDADYILFHQNIIIVKKHGELIGLPPTKRYEKFTLKKLNSEIKLVEDIGGIQRERFRAILNGIFERKTKLHFYNQSGNIFIDSLSRTTGITFVNGNEQLSWGTVSDAVKEGLTNFLNDFSFIFPKKISHIYLSIVPPKNRKPIPEDEKELLFFIESIRETEDISLSTEFRFTQEDLILLGRTGRYSGVLMSRAFGVIFNKEILNDCAEFKKAVGQQTIAIAEKHFALRGISVSETKLLRKIFIQEGIKFIQSREQLAEPIRNFMNKLFEQSKQIGSSNLIIHS
ncbi:MAG: hypothetical protein HY063_04280 [Bacteroidetes bacterium]|nr:hypothetical protein [Bacteroidota bacterium]